MNITTLEQAGRHLMEVGAVDTKTMMVEGRRLLEVCGLDTEKAAQSIARQIDKHGFEVEKDFYGNIIAPLKPVNNKVIVATDEEIAQNPRARSAKLRVAEK